HAHAHTHIRAEKHLRLFCMIPPHILSQSFLHTHVHTYNTITHTHTHTHTHMFALDSLTCNCGFPRTVCSRNTEGKDQPQSFNHKASCEHTHTHTHTHTYTNTHTAVWRVW